MDSWARQRAAPSPTTNTLYRRRRFQTPSPSTISSTDRAHSVLPRPPPTPAKRDANSKIDFHISLRGMSSPSKTIPNSITRGRSQSDRQHRFRPPSSSRPSTPQKFKPSTPSLSPILSTLQLGKTTNQTDPSFSNPSSDKLQLYNGIPITAASPPIPGNSPSSLLQHDSQGQPKYFLDQPILFEGITHPKKPTPDVAKNRPLSGKRLHPLTPNQKRTLPLPANKLSPDSPWSRLKSSPHHHQSRDANPIGGSRDENRLSKSASEERDENSHRRNEDFVSVPMKSLSLTLGRDNFSSTDQITAGLRRQYSSPALSSGMVKHPTSKRRLRTSSMSSCSTTSQQSKQLRFGICTVGGGVAGTPKENQDAYFIENSPAIVSIDQFALVEHNVVLQRRSQAQSTSYRFVTPPEIHGVDFIVGVLDGHGINGQKVSSLAKRSLPKEIKQGNLMNATESALRDGFQSVARAVKSTGFNTRDSGTTAVVCIKQKNVIITANVGDSRAVLGRRLDGSRVAAIPLSRDHKPSDRLEMLRIQRTGGIVEPSHVPSFGFQGPMRVWKRRQQVGGLALSRSIGDTALTSAGVVSDPEITVQSLTSEDEVLVLASDGVWDHLSNQQVIELACKITDPQVASNSIAKEARRQWTKQGGGYIDDVTVLVVRFPVGVVLSSASSTRRNSFSSP